MKQRERKDSEKKEKWKRERDETYIVQIYAFN
jgi:hypothetical protein